MNLLNHLPNVWLLDKYYFFWSSSTTVSQVYLLPASKSLPYRVYVFLIVSYWMLVEFCPTCSDVTTVSIATPIPNLSVLVGFPNKGRRDSV